MKTSVLRPRSNAFKLISQVKAHVAKRNKAAYRVKDVLATKANALLPTNLATFEQIALRWKNAVSI